MTNKKINQVCFNYTRKEAYFIFEDYTFKIFRDMEMYNVKNNFPEEILNVIVIQNTGQNFVFYSQKNLYFAQID